MGSPSKTAIYRVIDANFNRLREGLRVIEEVGRLVYGKASWFTEFKKLRHSIEQCVGLFAVHDLLMSRDSDHDVGRTGSIGQEMARASVNALLIANFKRTEEAARVLEEFCKLVNPEVSIAMKEIRFRLYSLEKRVFIPKKT